MNNNTLLVWRLVPGFKGTFSYLSINSRYSFIAIYLSVSKDSLNFESESDMSNKAVAEIPITKVLLKSIAM